jgi:hypothetical protein
VLFRLPNDLFQILRLLMIGQVRDIPNATGWTANRDGLKWMIRWSVLTTNQLPKFLSVNPTVNEAHAIL